MKKWNWKKNKKWFVIGLGVVLTAAAIAAGVMTGGVSVKTAVAEQGEVVKLLKESGTVESESTVIVAAKNAGEIKGLAVSEGDRVTAGDLLMTGEGTSAALDIKSRKAQLSGLQVQYNRAKELAAKNKNLYEQGALSYEDYQASSAEAKQLGSQVSSLQYSIKSAEESTGAAGVSAPIDGVITQVFVKEGETAAAGASLFEISNLNDTYVKVDLIAEDADQIKEGDPARVYNDDTGFSDDKAKVRKIYLKAQEKMSDLGVNQKRVTTEIEFSAGEVPRLGSDVDVEITAAKKENVLRVSDLAVFELDRKKYVYVVTNGEAKLNAIETGLEGEDYIEVRSGLSAGETVIVSPGDEVSEGTRVKALEQK